MTKLYAASEDEKSAEAPDSDEELLRADEVSGSKVPVALGRFSQPVACPAAISGWYIMMPKTRCAMADPGRPGRRGGGCSQPAAPAPPSQRHPRLQWYGVSDWAVHCCNGQMFCHARAVSAAEACSTWLYHDDVFNEDCSFFDSGATDEAVSPTQDYPPPRAGYGRRRR